MGPDEPRDDNISHIFQHRDRDPRTEDPRDSVDLKSAISKLLDVEPKHLPAYESPSPEHRNATMCPQCDRVTWRATEHCINCGYNLHAHADAVAREEARAFAAEQSRRLDVELDAIKWRVLYSIPFVVFAMLLMDLGGTWMMFIACLGLVACLLFVVTQMMRYAELAERRRDILRSNLIQAE